MINDFDMDLDQEILFVDVKVERYARDIIFSVVKKSGENIFEPCEIKHSLNKTKTEKIQL